jgi:orotidine-5'-phosphate decarboxylase
MSTPLIVALDFPSVEKAKTFVKGLSPADCKLKVGFELFVAGGPDFVSSLVEAGFDVFLDLKFHDIPNTVASACKAAARLGVWMINVHASGSNKMLVAAKEALTEFDNPPKLIAVTVLTSMDDAQLKAVGLNLSPQEQVLALAKLAYESGLDGLVCSAQEAGILRQAFPAEFLLVTPGIRPEGSAVGDQHRVMTPVKAIEAGVNYLVVGRPITQADNPKQVIDDINRSLPLKEN